MKKLSMTKQLVCLKTKKHIKKWRMPPIHMGIGQASQRILDAMAYYFNIEENRPTDFE